MVFPPTLRRTVGPGSDTLIDCAQPDPTQLVGWWLRRSWSSDSAQHEDCTGHGDASVFQRHNPPGSIHGRPSAHRCQTY
jgi:hypothetical protein